jgi:hypothetical protein
MCLNETYTTIRVGKNLSDIFPIRNVLEQGDALSPSLFNFALECATRWVQVDEKGLKLKGPQFRLMIHTYWAEVSTINDNRESFVAASKVTGLEVNAD